MQRAVLLSLVLTAAAIACSDDEADPPRVCTEVELECADGGCIPLEEACDGTEQCSDGSDEGGAICAGCEDDQEACDDGTCIGAEELCDGTPQCPDLSDEDAEFCADYCPGEL